MAIQLYKRANDKSGSEKDPKDPNKQKWNAQSIYVNVDGEMVPFSELEKIARKNAYVPLQKAENEIEIDGVNHNAVELIEMYRASKKNSDDNSDKNDPALQAGIKGMKKFAAKKNKEMEDDDMKDNEVAGAVEDNEDENAKAAAGKKNEDAGKEELEKGEEEGAKKVVVKKGNKKMKDNETPDEKGDKGAVSKENKEEDDEKENEMEDDEKENEVDEDEDIKKKIMKNNKDARHFIRLNSARENGTAEAGVLTIDTMYNRIDRGISKYGSGK